MSQKMTREELVDLVETITTMRNKSTNELLSEKEIHALVLKFENWHPLSSGSNCSSGFSNMAILRDCVPILTR